MSNSRRFPSLRLAEVVGALERLGFRIQDITNHTIMYNEATRRKATIPNHNPVKTSTLRGILTQSGITREEFIAALGKKHGE